MHFDSAGDLPWEHGKCFDDTGDIPFELDAEKLSACEPMKWQRGELQAEGDSFERMLKPMQRLQHPMASRELQENSSACIPKEERSIQHIHKDTGGRTREVIRSIELASLSALPSLSPPSSSMSRGTFTISHHISHPGSGQEPDNPPVSQESIQLKKVRLNLGTYNIRGLKRFGRQSELSHLLEKRITWTSWGFRKPNAQVTLCQLLRRDFS